jgi:hypothetical protein
LGCFSVLIWSSLWSEERWIIGKYETITIVSNASEKRTQKVFEEIHLFEEAVKIIFDGSLEDTKWPLKVIVCKNKKTFNSIAAERKSNEREIGGFYSYGRGYDLVVLRSDTESESLKQMIYSGLAHRILKDLGNIPLWLDVGYASVFQQISIGTKEIEIGRANKSYLTFLANQKPMPLDRLFKVHRTSDEFRNSALATKYFATCWAFVHMCLYALDSNLSDPLLAFTKDLENEIVTEELFTTHFQMSFEEMAERLEYYVKRGRYQYRKVKVDERFTMPQIKFDKGSEFAKNLYLGTTLIHSRRLRDARSCLLRCQYGIPTLQESSSKENRKQHAQLNAEFATLERVAGNNEVAEDYAKVAFELGTDDFSALMIYAESILSLVNGERSVGRLSTDQLNTVLKALATIFAKDLENKRAHQIHAVAWRYSNITPKESHLRALLLACGLFPDDKVINLSVAEVLRRSGQRQNAINVLEHFINSTQDEDSRDEALVLLEQIRGGEQ